MKYGIEFEFFVSQKNKIIPAYLATSNLDGDPFIGEIKTKPFNKFIDCIFELEKLIYLEQQKLNKAGFRMEIISECIFDNNSLIEFRKNKSALNLKELAPLQEFSIYPNKKISKILKRGHKKASLQLNLSNTKNFSYTTYNKVTIGKQYSYNAVDNTKSYNSIFNYVDIIQKLDSIFQKDINTAKRVKGVYTIKSGVFGDRIEYRSLPNTINLRNLFNV